MAAKISAFMFLFLLLIVVQMFAFPGQTARGMWCGFGVERYCSDYMSTGPRTAPR